MCYNNIGDDNVKEIIKKIRVDIISLIMIIACTYFLGILGLIISPVLLIIYIKTAREHYRFKKIIIFLCFIGIALGLFAICLMNNMENTGIDYIGEAIGYAFIFKIGYFLTISGLILLLIIDNRKFIFKKKVVVTLLIIVMLIFLFFVFKYLFSTEKVSEDIPTVGDFEKELIQRDFKTDNNNYRLYGVNNKSDKAIALSFEKNNNDKYPLYIYTIIDYPWIIYYANGDIYAVKGKYWDYYTAYNRKTGYNEEKIIWEYSLDNIIKSEKEEVSIYNRKYNRYEKGNTITAEGFNYYSKNENTENSVFVDIPCIESWGSKIEKIDRIDKKSLGY